MEGNASGAASYRNKPGLIDLPPAVSPPSQFGHADQLTGVTVRVSGAGSRYPNALCGRCVLSWHRQRSTRTWASCSVETSSPFPQLSVKGFDRPVLSRTARLDEYGRHGQHAIPGPTCPTINSGPLSGRICLGHLLCRNNSLKTSCTSRDVRRGCTANWVGRESGHLEA